MTTGTVQILDPIADQINPPVDLAPRPKDLNGKVLALLDDNLTNVDMLLRVLETLSKSRYNLAGTVWYNRETTEGIYTTDGRVQKTTGDDLAQVAAKSDVAITGVGD